MYLSIQKQNYLHTYWVSLIWQGGGDTVLLRILTKRREKKKGGLILNSAKPLSSTNQSQACFWLEYYTKRSWTWEKD